MPTRRAQAEPRESDPIISMMTPADYVSVLNATAGLLAIFLISLDHIPWAVIAILVAVIGDGVDGGLARIGYGGGALGGKLDSFADFTAFAVAPALLLFHTYYQWEIVTQVRGPDFLTALAVGATAAAFFAAGLLRLVRFEVLRGGSRQDFFVGLSIPAAALVVTIATYLGWSSQRVIPLTILLAVLMVSRLRYPKIRGLLVPPALAALLGAVFLGSRFDYVMPKVLFAMMATYVLIGPVIVRWKEHRLDEFDPTPQA